MIFGVPSNSSLSVIHCSNIHSQLPSICIQELPTIDTYFGTWEYTLMSIFSIKLSKFPFNLCHVLASVTSHTGGYHRNQYVEWIFLPSSWGNSSHKMAMEVLSPWNRDNVKEAPIAKPSKKLCTASLSVTIQAMVPIFDSGRPPRHLHKLPWISSSWKNNTIK